MQHDHLDALESESIFIMREAFAKFDNLAMLWSIGKDSTVLLWLARKAFFGHVPFPLVHIDTSLQDSVDDRVSRSPGPRVEPAARRRQEQAGARGGHAPIPTARPRASNAAARSRRTACSRSSSTTATPASSSACAATRIRRARRSATSPRATRTWNGTRRTSRRSSGTSSRPISRPGTHIRIHPLLHWTELNVWEYIEREKIPIIPLYFADGTGQRYRSLGCAPCTFPIQSTAKTVAEIVSELKATKIPERAGRAQDKESEDAFEKLRRDGYM